MVLASAAPYGDQFCGKPVPPGSFTGKIVVCVRGGVDATGAPVGRVQKGFNVLKGGAEKEHKLGKDANLVITIKLAKIDKEKKEDKDTKDKDRETEGTEK